jgi:hypothetical protein
MQSETRSATTVPKVLAPETGAPLTRVVADEVFGGKRVWIYENGMVAFGFFSPSVLEKLLAIDGNSDVSRKSALGRGMVALLTFGTNLLLTPNKRGGAYLTIVTDSQTRHLSMSPPTEHSLRALSILETAGKSVISARDARTSNAVIGNAGETESTDIAESLRAISELAAGGKLTAAEFAAAKAKILGLRS